ncbi:MAG: hypothetical protein ACLROS_03820 [Faecalibacterium sp.]
MEKPGDAQEPGTGLGTKKKERGLTLSELKYTRICELCGKKMENVGRRRQFCDSCLAEKRRVQDRKKNQLKNQKKDRRHLEGASIEEVCRLADAAGMSYGVYVAKNERCTG